MASSGLRDRWLAWRNRWLADPGFQRWAADFPLTRGVARRQAGGLFDLVSGFVYAQTLFVALRLGLFDLLAAEPRAPEDLAHALDLNIEVMERLLGACAALGLLERAEHGRWTLAMKGAALRGQAGLKEMILHHADLYADLADPEALLRRQGGGGRLAAYWPYAQTKDPARTCEPSVRPYSALMAATQPVVAADLLDAYDVSRHDLLLDVGGGEGAFLVAAAARAPALRLALLDLPAVSRAAKARLEREGLGDRATVYGGDFLSEPLPQGADLITLVRILHDHDDEGVARLLRSARAALPGHGALLIGEPMSAAPRPDPVADAYFAFYLLAMGRGRARTPAELEHMLQAAGFGRVRRLRTRNPLFLRALVAQP
jgi:demethylspheroidene O-methyltransferase